MTHWRNVTVLAHSVVTIHVHAASSSQHFFQSCGSGQARMCFFWHGSSALRQIINKSDLHIMLAMSQRCLSLSLKHIFCGAVSSPSPDRTCCSKYFSAVPTLVCYPIRWHAAHIAARLLRNVHSYSTASSCITRSIALSTLHIPVACCRWLSASLI